MEEDIYPLDVLIRGCVEDDDDGADEAGCAAEFSQYPESFVEEVRAENGAGWRSARDD